MLAKGSSVVECSIGVGLSSVSALQCNSLRAELNAVSQAGVPDCHSSSGLVDLCAWDLL